MGLRPIHGHDYDDGQKRRGQGWVEFARGLLQL